MFDQATFDRLALFDSYSESITKAFYELLDAKTLIERYRPNYFKSLKVVKIDEYL
jgi:hypothetical protein